jgi:predicted nucleic acid-binding protein
VPAAVSLLEVAPAPALRCYLDTSAVWVLASLEAKANGATIVATDETNGKRVESFLKRLVAARGEPRTTVLAMEELAAKVRNNSRSESARRAHCSDWRQFKRADPTAADAADALAKTAMLDAMRFAATRLGKLAVLFETPAVHEAETFSAATSIRKEHRLLLDNYQGLDAMDALHIVMGSRLRIQHFVSLDRGWSDVNGLTIYK